MAMLNHQRVPMWTTYSLLPNPAMGKIYSNSYPIDLLYPIYSNWSHHHLTHHLHNSALWNHFWYLSHLSHLSPLYQWYPMIFLKSQEKSPKKKRWKSLAVLEELLLADLSRLRNLKDFILALLISCRETMWNSWDASVGITENRCVEQPNK